MQHKSFQYEAITGFDGATGSNRVLKRDFIAEARPRFECARSRKWLDKATAWSRHGRELSKQPLQQDRSIGDVTPRTSNLLNKLSKSEISANAAAAASIIRCKFPHGPWKGKVATIKCHSCARVMPDTDGLHCDASFAHYHPWHRAKHDWSPISQPAVEFSVPEPPTAPIESVLKVAHENIAELSVAAAEVRPSLLGKRLEVTLTLRSARPKFRMDCPK